MTWHIHRIPCQAHESPDLCAPACDRPWIVEPPDRDAQTFPTLSRAIAWYKHETEGNT